MFKETGVRNDAMAWTGSSGLDPARGTSRVTAVDIRPMGDGFRLTASVVVPRPIGEVFEFFADAGNLDLLTPTWLRFQILTPLPATMREGLLLDYRLRLRGIPVTWQSEITAWEPPHRFIDEQRRGPYLRWVHEHLFQAKESGTEVADRVDYAVFGGSLVHRLFVKGDVASIFQYRRQKLMEVFQGDRGAIGQTSAPAAV